MENKYHEIYLDTIQEAYDLVMESYNKGLYDIFRGQKESWPLNTSLSRIPETEREPAYQRLNYFFEWIHKNMPEFVESELKILSVAQHYGLPTTLIDFSYDPEVAFFFATHNNKKTKQSCIYCASKKDLESNFKNLQTVYGFNAGIVEIEVGNLWRLESQKGLFLHIPFDGLPNIETQLPFHKIIFPYDTSFKSKYVKDIIYPNRKSALEIKLDQHFREEYVQTGLNTAEENGFKIVTSSWKSNFFVFTDGNIPAGDPAWEDSDAESWKAAKAEKFHETVLQKTFEINIDIKEPTLSDIHQIFLEKISNELLMHPSVKNYTVTFKVYTSDKKSWPRKSIKALQLFWDGIRQFPYPDIEISEGIANLAAMLYSGTINKKDYIASVVGETRTFDCLIKNGGHFRVPIPVMELSNAINKHLLTKIDKAYYPDINSALDIMEYVYDVGILFNHDRFRKLFATLIIPCQIISNMDSTGYYSGGGETRLLVVFSPFEIIAIRSFFAPYSNKIYRDKERVFPIHPNFTDQELMYVMAYGLNRINADEKAITITISGFENNPAELHQIPEAIDFCKRLIGLSFISIMEVSTSLRVSPDTFDPSALGGFEVWLIANKKMEDLKNGENALPYVNKYMNELPMHNSNCDDLVGPFLNIASQYIEGIRLKGFGFL